MTGASTKNTYTICIPTAVRDDSSSARKDFDDEEMLKVLERCYNVLHGRRGSNSISAASTMTTTSTTTGPISFISKHMKKYTFDTVKARLTRLDHNLYDLIWPSVKKLPIEANFRTALEQDFPAGVVIPDVYCYAVFNEFLEPFVKDLHCIDIAVQLNNHPTMKFCEAKGENGEESDNKIFNVDIDLDPAAKMIVAGNFNSCARFSQKLSYILTFAGFWLTFKI